MKKLLFLFVAFASTGGCVLPFRAVGAALPAAFRGNWIDTATNLWALSLWDDFAVLDASFWEYGKWNSREKNASALLTRSDGSRRKVTLELLNDTTLVLQEGKKRRFLLHESPTVALRPFTAPPDTVPFRSVPWVDDSIRVEGFIVGYKPGDPVYHYWLSDIFGFDRPNTPMNTDSLGRFRVSIPATHDQLYTIGTTVVAGPGTRLFIAYSSEGERHLFMGDNARVNQELNTYPLASTVRQFLPQSDPNEQIAEVMSWRFARLTLREMALQSIDDYCREHNLSRKTQQAFRSSIKYLITSEIVTIQNRLQYVIFPYAYYLPDRWIDYADPELFFFFKNDILYYPFSHLFSEYGPFYLADRGGFQGKDRETFLNPAYFRQSDPERFQEFVSRNRSVLDSLNAPIPDSIRIRWMLPVAEMLVPAGGMFRDIAFAQGVAVHRSFVEEPLSDETSAWIDSILCESPFLRDTLRRMNDRYRMLAERNATELLPWEPVDPALSQPDSLLAAIVAPHAGKVVCLLYEEENPLLRKELRHLPAVRERLKEHPVDFVILSVGNYPQKWRNVIAEYGLAGRNTTRCGLTPVQLQMLLQKYKTYNGLLLLIDPAGRVVVGPVPKLSEPDRLVGRIDELLGR